MVAEFRGPAPHDLGVAELATARFLNENIEMSLHVVDDWHRPTAQLVRVQITPAAARSLLDNRRRRSRGEQIATIVRYWE
jgi:hypothetical protein